MPAHEILCGVWRALVVTRIETNYRLRRADPETAELVQRI